jgi:hypothetical protein
MTNDELDSLVARLRITRSYLVNHPTHGSWREGGVVERGIDAITALRANLAAKDATLGEMTKLARKAEVERDYLIKKRDSASLGVLGCVIKALTQERNKALADLAAARELLHDLRPHVLCGYNAPLTGAIDLYARIDAFIAQSAPAESKDHDLERNE